MKQQKTTPVGKVKQNGEKLLKTFRFFLILVKRCEYGILMYAAINQISFLVEHVKEEEALIRHLLLFCLQKDLFCTYSTYFFFRKLWRC